MSLVVTGATGFIGMRLVEKLCAAGLDVRCLVRRTSRTAALEALGVRIFVADLRDGSGLDRALDGASGVIHVAGEIRSWTSGGYFETNTRGTRVLTEAAGRAGVRRFILVSSVAAAGPSAPGRELTEDLEPRPVGAYGKSKLAAEQALASCGNGLDWSIIRPSIVYGPRDRQVLPLFRLAAWGVVPYTSPARARLSFVHVDDLVDLIIAASKRAAPGAVYFCSDGGSYLWEDLIRAIGEVLGRRVRPIRIPPLCLWPPAACMELLRPFRARPPVFCLQKLLEASQSGWVCSPERARLDLGYEPRLKLQEGIRDTVEWYRAAGWL
jgi:dihydroflavonol-4-reductase